VVATSRHFGKTSTGELTNRKGCIHHVTDIDSDGTGSATYQARGATPLQRYTLLKPETVLSVFLFEPNPALGLSGFQPQTSLM
jgi:hypothetical protein